MGLFLFVEKTERDSNKAEARQTRAAISSGECAVERRRARASAGLGAASGQVSDAEAERAREIPPSPH